MIKIGQKIDTSISLQLIEDGTERSVTLGELLTRPLVVSVYMKNNTNSCDNQNRSLVEHAEAIKAKGFGLLAVSKDTCGSHKKYAAKLGIDYLLASDPENELSKLTDSIVEKSMYGRKYQGPSRSAFVIGTNGEVKAIIEKIDSKNHGTEILSLLDTLV